MIQQFDTFVQLKSLYKAGLKLHKLGLVKIKAIRFDMSFTPQKKLTKCLNYTAQMTLLKLLIILYLKAKKSQQVKLGFTYKEIEKEDLFLYLNHCLIIASICST